MDFLTELLKFLGSESRSKIAVLLTIIVIALGFLVAYEYYTASFRLGRLQKETDLLVRLQEVQMQGTNIISPELIHLRAVLLTNVTKTIEEKPISLDFVPSKLTFSFDSVRKFFAGACFWWVFAVFYLPKRKTVEGKNAFNGLIVLAVFSGIIGLFVSPIWWPWFHIFIFPWLLIIGVFVALIPFAIIISNYQSAKNKALTNACINNLRHIDAATNVWALENSKPQDAIPTEQDLLPYFAGSVFPKCPMGGAYKLNTVKAIPTCTVKGHHLSH